MNILKFVTFLHCVLLLAVNVSQADSIDNLLRQIRDLDQSDQPTALALRYENLENRNVDRSLRTIDLPQPASTAAFPQSDPNQIENTGDLSLVRHRYQGYYRYSPRYHYRGYSAYRYYPRYRGSYRYFSPRYYSYRYYRPWYTYPRPYYGYFYRPYSFYAPPLFSPYSFGFGSYYSFCY